MDAHRIHGLPPSAWYIEEFITEAEEEYLLKKIAESPVPRWKTTPTGRRLQYLGGTLTKNNILIPEPLPTWCTEFPDLVQRITQVTDVFDAEGDAPGEGKPNQVLINEYARGQGIAPHEDGPAYYPAVATLTLAAAQCIDIYQYLSTTNPSPPLVATPTTDTSATSQTSETQEQGGRTIANVPLARIYLAPRSLLVMASALYTTHLHGISETTEDVIITADAQEPDRTTARPGSVSVVNLDLLSPGIQRTVREKGEYRSERGTRVSLTFRRVGRVMKGGALGGKLFGKR